MSTPPSPSAMAAAGTVPCGNCGDPMRVLQLVGHYGRAVELDLCEPCHLVWFDGVESARLNGPAMLGLVGDMARAQTLPHRTLRPDASCPRCRGGLKTVHNQSRWGRSLQLECLRQHGAHQSFAQFLFEKGLVRPMSSADRAALLARDGRIACVNCGAAVGAGDAECPHCRSVPSLLDVARLARALDPEGALEAQPVHATAAQRAALQCGACGAALGTAASLQCDQCGATLAVSRLADAHREVATLGPALKAHADKPAAQVVQRRMEALAGDMPRQRDWLARMRADNPSRDEADEGAFDWRIAPVRAVFIALLLWFAWRWWG